MKPRILQIVPTLGRTGTARQMALVAQGLRAEFDLHVCALERGGPVAAELTEAGIPVTVLGQRWRLDPLAWWRLRRLVAHLRPDLIHAWNFTANVYGCSAARACGVRRTVAGYRSGDATEDAVQRALDGWVGRHCGAVVVYGQAMRESCLARRLPDEKVRTITNGVPPAAPGADRGQLLVELGLPEASRIVGLAGPLVFRKRVKDSIWAADLLKVIRDDVHLLVFGDGPHRDRLCRYRDQVLIADKVHFLGDRGDLFCWMPYFDVFWSTSGLEGQSRAVLEAMAAGVPVVASDIPGNRELVLDGKTGYLVRVGHRAGFARWTNQLLDDPALARQFGAAGRQRAREEFSAEKMVQRHAEVYRELLG